MCGRATGRSTREVSRGAPAIVISSVAASATTQRLSTTVRAGPARPRRNVRSKMRTATAFATQQQQQHGGHRGWSPGRNDEHPLLSYQYCIRRKVSTERPHGVHHQQRQQQLSDADVDTKQSMKRDVKVTSFTLSLANCQSTIVSNSIRFE